MSNSPAYARIELLLANYQQEHPFPAKPEHTDERGLRTALYTEAVFAYNQTFCQNVQAQAQLEGIVIHRYQLSKGRWTQESFLYDLRVDDGIVLHAAHFHDAYEYALQQMQNEDLYCEAAMELPCSGRELRRSHNVMEADFASDGTYVPKYSYGPGPFTSEQREQ